MSEKKVERVRKNNDGTKCLIAGCGGAVKSRGLCVSHYSIASGRVKAGTGSWGQFEKLGVSLPAERTLRVSQFDAAIAAAGK